MFKERLDPYKKLLWNATQPKHLETLVRGHLERIPDKNIQAIYDELSPPTNQRSMYDFMKKGKWDEDELLEYYQTEMGQLYSHPAAMITIDGSDFGEKGKESAAVARQRESNRGKTDNCQAGVMLGLTSPLGHCLLDYELFRSRALGWIGLCRKAKEMPHSREIDVPDKKYYCLKDAQ